VTAASAVAGTDPTLTARSRLFLGEADTGAATVSAVRTYAYQRKYKSPLTAIPAASSRTTFAANLGVDPQFVSMRTWIRFNSAWNGYSPGTVVPATTYYLGTNPPYLDPNAIEDQNVCAFLNNANGIQIAVPRSAPNSYGTLPTGSGTAQIYVEARGTF
jgi:hypothetical protein